MEKLELRVTEISKAMANKGIYVLLLQEKSGERKLPLMIGSVEAQTLAAKMHSSDWKHPMMPDLLYRLASNCEIDLDEILIYKVEEGVMWAYLFFFHDGKIEQIEARASDAICLALTFSAPIYVDKALFERQYMKEVSKGMVSLPINSLSLELLKEALNSAVRDENYELASQLRDEIKRRE